MKRLLQTASVSLLALLVGVGCGSSESENVATESTPANAGAAAEAPSPQEQETPKYEGPIFIPGLTPPTDARDILARDGEEPGLSRGVVDPFAIIPVDAIGQLPQPSPGEPAPVATQNGGEEIVTEPEETIPGTSRADAVRITGIVKVGNTLRAIIKSPDEPTSRHVRTGQLIAGTVLVKSIDINQSVPVVILEEAGVEVPKYVGQEPDVASSFIASSSSATALIPPPPPSGTH